MSVTALCPLAALVVTLAGARATTAGEPAARPPLHAITVDVRGPLAMVQVTRALPSLLALTGADGARASSGGRESLMDVALPDGAALVDVAVHDGDRWHRAPVAEGPRARGLYREGLRARGLTYREEPIDESATHRVRLTYDQRRAGRPLRVRYRFSALTRFLDGRYRLRFPPSPELSPVSAEVAVTAAGVTDVQIAGVRTNRGQSPARSGWEISYTLRTPTDGRRPAEGFAGSAVAAAVGQRESALAVAVHAVPSPPVQSPDSVVFVIDRSRSVGLPGLAAERDVARRLLESLPPATRFDALFFDRAVHRLFPAARPATREAIAALDAEMVPDRLTNGTDLTAALRDAGGLLRREAAWFGPRTLLAIITDGALPDEQDGAELTRALGAVSGLGLNVAVLVVRDPEDGSVSRAARQALRRLIGTHGGLLREISSSDIAEGVAGMLADLTRGGDLSAIALVAGGERRLLADAIGPAGGVWGVARFPSNDTRVVDLQATVHGRVATVSLRPTLVDATWLRPHVAADDAPTSRVVTTATLTALVEAVSPRPPEEPQPPPRGDMDRGVIRNTLSLAFMPRARACYQTRSGATPALRELTGRVRLAIDIVRGEVAAARVESSSLMQPQIETCLREAAFALDVPRAYRNDAPVTAVLNLVFRPRTPEKKRSDEDLAALGHEIDLVLDQLHRSAPDGGADRHGE